MPFLIMTELLIGFGVIQGIGILLEPLMRIVFRLPGVSGWALASGLIVGFPAGAKITAYPEGKKPHLPNRNRTINGTVTFVQPLIPDYGRRRWLSA